MNLPSPFSVFQNLQVQTDSEVQYLSNMSSMRIDWLSNFNVNIFNNYYMACKQDFKVIAESVLAKVPSRLDKSSALFTRILGSAERNGYVA